MFAYSSCITSRSVGAERDALEPEEPADAVIDVDDVVAGLQVAEVGDERFRRFPLPNRRLRRRRLEQIRLGDHAEVHLVEVETARERAAGDHQILREPFSLVDERDVEFAEQALDFFPAAAAGGEENLSARGGPARREVPRELPEPIDPAAGGRRVDSQLFVLAGHVKVAQRQAGAAQKVVGERRREEKAVGGEHDLSALRRRLVLGAEKRLIAIDRRRDLVGVDRDDPPPAREHLGEPRALAGERDEVLDPREGSVFLEALDFLGDVALPDRVGELAREQLGERVQRRARTRELRHRIKEDALDPVEGPLRVRLEVADRLDGVAEELEPDRLVCVRRKDVENSPAEGDLARFADEIGARVPPFGERLEERAKVELIPLPDLRDPRLEFLLRRKAAEQGARSEDQKVDLASDQRAEGADLVPDDGEGGIDLLVGGERWVRIDDHARGGGMEEREGPFQVLKNRVRGDDERDALAGSLGERGEEKRARLERGAGHLDAPQGVLGACDPVEERRPGHEAPDLVRDGWAGVGHRRQSSGRVRGKGNPGTSERTADVYQKIA